MYASRAFCSGLLYNYCSDPFKFQNRNSASAHAVTINPSVYPFTLWYPHAHIYATMAEAVEDTYFQVGASLPTWDRV